jgi:CDP-paratose 2-epimerase
MNFLITGGAGFIGSNLAISLKRSRPSSEVTCFDNLKRRGSELNLNRLKENGVRFIHGDIRNTEDFQEVPSFDMMIECSAEPSVLAGINSSPSYVLNTNLTGTINCLEEVRKKKADIIFLSTSRVYPIRTINQLPYKEERTRYSLSETAHGVGVSKYGINEEFPLQGPRSLYGATKLCSEYLLQEYIDSYNIRGIINRCGLVAGPWQMGKIDQGVVMLWVACHLFRKNLTYIGYDGSGKQVRDVLHVDDLCSLILRQVEQIEDNNGEIFNVGGGTSNSISLQEMSTLCREITGENIPIGSDPETRSNDLTWYITDISKVTSSCNWKPQYSVKDTISDIYRWLESNRDILYNII